MSGTEDISTVMDLINVGDVRFIFACNDAVHALGLMSILDDLTIVTYAPSPLTDIIRSSGKRVLFLEDEVKGFNKLRTTNNLITHPFFKDLITGIDGKKSLLTFKNSSVTENCAKELGLKLIAAEAHIARGIESKVSFYEALIEEDVDLLPGEVVTMTDDLSYDDIAEKYGDTVVLQAAKGFAGAKTFYISSEADFLRIRETYRDRRMRLTKFVDGETITINACVTRFGTVVKPPFRQLTGIPGLTLNRMGACGNDFCLDGLDEDVINEIVSTTETLGDIIYKRGYRGFFGVDYIISGPSVYFIECNPRFVTSLPIFTRLELSNGEVPLLALHILEHTGKTGAASDIIERMKANTGKNITGESITGKNITGESFYSGAQLILHNLEDEPVQIRSDMKSGVYDISTGGLEFVREALYVDDIASESELLIIIKPKGIPINSNMECARILTKGRALTGGVLTDEMSAIIGRMGNLVAHQ